MFPSGSFTIKDPVKLKKIIHYRLVAAFTFRILEITYATPHYT